MSEEEPIVSTSEPSQSIFTRLLSTWAENRRLIAVLIMASGLGGLLWSLEPQTRRALVRGLLANQALFTLLLTFSLLTLSLLWSAGQRLDAWVFMLFNLRGHHPLWLDRIMWGFTQIGNGLVGILLGAVLYFANLRPLAIQLLLGILSLWLLVEFIKALVDRRRPFVTLTTTRVIGWRERGLSFPSGHTTQTFFMAVVLAQYFQVGPILNSLIFGTAVIVGFTRVYVGAHYPRDVIGGAILGSVWGIVSRIIQGYLATGQF